ncbi:WapI family immunity protein, partial [Nocardioides panacisoli]|uniref:WapI family immunity protein n=1 Tax=Nocardioides panacisoli TaxID=627624 RepID=UPI0031D011A1
ILPQFDRHPGGPLTQLVGVLPGCCHDSHPPWIESLHQTRGDSEFRIGSTDAEHLTITVLGREHPGADDYWDGNWIIATVSIGTGSFTGQVRGSLRMDEIHRFNEGLKFLNQNLFGAAVLETMEDWITLTVKAESSGRIQISGELADGAGIGNVLQFRVA